MWTVKGIKTIEHIFEHLFLLMSLNKRFVLPNHYFFGFLQITHAFSTQFSSQLVTLLQSNLESLLRDEQLDKLLSNIYEALMPSVYFGLERDYILYDRRISLSWMQMIGKTYGNIHFFS